MTVADIRSVSPVAWTDWKAGLLEAFYRNAAEWLEAGAEEAQADLFFLERAAERAAKGEERVLAELAAAGDDVARAADLLDSMPRRFLLNHPPLEIAAHVRAALDYIESGRKVGVYTLPRSEDASHLGLVVFAPDQHGLFASIAGVLTSLGHDILGAQAYTSRTSLAVDILQLALRAGGPEEDEAERERVEERLSAVLAGRHRLDPQRRHGQAAQAAGRARPPRIGFTNEESDFHTIIDVHADDRPGLLYDIARTLSELGLDVVRANIATRAHRVTDAFYVTDAGHKIQDEARRAAIEARLLAVIPRGAA
jgi:[protein-PII] uridylyltransferase